MNITELRSFIRETIRESKKIEINDDEDYSWWSDRYKEEYGSRPRMSNEELEKWANRNFELRGNQIISKSKSVKEASQTGTGSSFQAGEGEAYATPFAFKKNKRLVKRKLNEVSYREFRKNTEATPKQKIGNSMKEVAKKINEINKLIKYNKKLKEDMGMGSGKYWKSTKNALAKLSEKIKTLNNDILQLGN
jgi:hypothetical protein